jgi:outer membrane murein-binding lipoprotein Lpp
MIESGKFALRRADNAGVKRTVAALFVATLFVAGCSTDSEDEGPNAYKFAYQACQTTGAAAVSLSARAAKLDPKYAQLANDEAALYQNLQAANSGGDDIQGLTGVNGTGRGSSAQVTLDCAQLAKSIIPGVE